MRAAWGGEGGWWNHRKEDHGAKNCYTFTVLILERSRWWRNEKTWWGGTKKLVRLPSPDVYNQDLGLRSSRAKIEPKRTLIFLLTHTQVQILTCGSQEGVSCSSRRILEGQRLLEHDGSGARICGVDATPYIRQHIDPEMCGNRARGTVISTPISMGHHTATCLRYHLIGVLGWLYPEG